MSRLCEDKQLETPSVVAPLINISAAILESFKLTKDQRDNISSHHNGIVGHIGVQSTIQRLLNSGFNWLHMRQHVINFVKIVLFVKNSLQLNFQIILIHLPLRYTNQCNV